MHVVYHQNLHLEQIVYCELKQLWPSLFTASGPQGALPLQTVHQRLPALLASLCMLQVTRFLVYLHQPGKWGKLSVPWLWYVSRWDHFWCDKSLYKIPGNCPSATCTTSYIMYGLLWIMAAQTGRCTFFVDIAYHFQKKWPSIVLLQSKYADILLKFGLLGQSHLKLSIFTPK